MIRTMLQMSRGLALIAVVSLPTVLRAQTPDKRQIVAILPFDNASFGPSAHDYDLVGKGIQDLLVTELASSSQVRVVDRAHLQAVMDEQKIARDQLADPATQVRLGKLLNAHFLIAGSLITDGKTQLQMTARSIDVETSQVGNPEKTGGKPDDLMGAINTMVARVSADLKLPAFTPSAPGVGSTQQGGASPKPAPASSPQTAPAASAPAASVETFAKPLTPDQAKKTATAPLDFRTAVIYSQAIDAQDKKDNAKAKQLFQQVLAKAPTFQPAKDHLDALQ